MEPARRQATGMAQVSLPTLHTQLIEVNQQTIAPAMPHQNVLLAAATNEG